jgi:hypothetical protein
LKGAIIFFDEHVCVRWYLPEKERNAHIRCQFGDTKHFLVFFACLADKQKIVWSFPREEAVLMRLTRPYRIREVPSLSVNRAWFLKSIGRYWLNRLIQIGHLRRLQIQADIIELFDWDNTPILPFRDRWLLLPEVEVVEVVEAVEVVDMERKGLNLLLEKTFNWL